MPYATLVSTDTLCAHLTHPGWVVVDCRHELGDADAGERAYHAGHVPGARFVHLDRDLAGAMTGSNGRHPLPAPRAFMARLGALGIDRQTQVVAYDAQAGAMCVRLWWMLRCWLGHEACAVLDGGWPRWTAEGRPESSEPPQIRSTRYVADVREQSIVDARFVQSHLGDESMLLIDARAPERFAGESESIDPAAGHIPGARNRPFRANLADDGRFKAPEQLHTEFSALLAGHPAAGVVHQCGSGVSACHNMLAMAHAGLPVGRLYVGSWSEWCADPARPQATGRD
jgi:thiosulfate/3-mercaptopyruvate sulfurtransferase